VAGPAPTLSQRSFLAVLDPSDRAALLHVGRPRRFVAGASLIRQGDDTDSVFILRRGWAKVTQTTVDGREILLALLGPGELVGEFEAVGPDRGPRRAGVVAIGTVDADVVVACDFRDFVVSHPNVTLALLQAVIRRLATADRRRIEASSLDVGHRLARFLLELTNLHGQPRSGGLGLAIPLAQHELATLIAASRESTVRALRTLRAQGLVVTSPRRITILDVEGLRRYAGQADARPSKQRSVSATSGDRRDRRLGMGVKPGG
jgi:CRP-like cAMP-binding protein